MLGGNAARLYGFDLEPCAPHRQSGRADDRRRGAPLLPDEAPAPTPALPGLRRRGRRRRRP